MKKENLFDKAHGIRLNPEELKNSVSIKLPDETAKFLKEYGVTFPYEYFERILRRHKLKPLEENLFKKWKESLPIYIHKACPGQIEGENKDSDKHCYQSWLEFSTLYLLSGNEFANMIENNKRFLRNITKERLAILFFQKAFVFENAISFFQVGEMSRLLLKEGLKKVSEDLKKLEIKTALQIANENLSNIRRNSLLNDDGFEDVEGLKKEFWEMEKENYLIKFQIEESTQLSFIDYFVRVIYALQERWNKEKCIDNIVKGDLLEHPFRDFFKNMLSMVFFSVEAEPEKGTGRADLKIKDNKLKYPIIIEFKGWWNGDKENVITQTIKYLTDFENEGFIFMINHNKEKRIVNDYKSKVVESQINYVNNSWKIITYNKTGYKYFTSKHIVKGDLKTINHFIFDVIID